MKIWASEASPRLDLQIQEKFIIILGPSDRLSVKYFSIFPLFMKIFSEMSDTTRGVSRRKWFNNDAYHVRLLCVISFLQTNLCRIE